MIGFAFFLVTLLICHSSSSAQSCDGATDGICLEDGVPIVAGGVDLVATIESLVNTVSDLETRLSIAEGTASNAVAGNITQVQMHGTSLEYLFTPEFLPAEDTNHGYHKSLSNETGSYMNVMNITMRDSVHLPHIQNSADAPIVFELDSHSASLPAGLTFSAAGELAGTVTDEWVEANWVHEGTYGILISATAYGVTSLTLFTFIFDPRHTDCTYLSDGEQVIWKDENQHDVYCEGGWTRVMYLPNGMTDLGNLDATFVPTTLQSDYNTPGISPAYAIVQASQWKMCGVVADLSHYAPNGQARITMKTAIGNSTHRVLTEVVPGTPTDVPYLNLYSGVGVDPESAVMAIFHGLDTSDFLIHKASTWDRSDATTFFNHFQEADSYNEGPCWTQHVWVRY